MTRPSRHEGLQTTTGRIRDIFVRALRRRYNLSTTLRRAIQSYRYHRRL